MTTKFNSCSSLSIEDQKSIENSDFSILSNPVKGDFLQVVFPKSIKKTDAFILDLSGKKIKQLKISVDKPKVFIGSLSKGLYLIQLKTLSTKKTFKIIKE
ncbi:T9SS type A sorting domain-containing protein [Tenacibaculum agarivorans]|uniref:T9SS type A sorting domain-containing protein n=1 Tax=Tenacibaculum agarivorans TaxID=1908389 RepID=UPI0009FB4769